MHSFLRSYHLQLEFAKLHIGSNTKQTAGAFDERRVGREGDVARLNEFDDFIFLAVVLQFHVLCIEIEGSIGVVIQVHVHLIAHLSVDVEIDFLIKSIIVVFRLRIGNEGLSMLFLLIPNLSSAEP